MMFINDRFKISQKYIYVQVFFKTSSLRIRRLIRPAVGKLMLMFILYLAIDKSASEII